MRAARAADRERARRGRQAEAALAYEDAAAHYEAALAEVRRSGRARPWRGAPRRGAAPTRHAAASPAPPEDAPGRPARRTGPRSCSRSAPRAIAPAVAPQAQAAFDEAIELARERRDPRLLARAALGRGGVGVLVAATDPAITRPIEEALALLPAHERALAARLRARLAIEFYYPTSTRPRR